MKIILVFVSTLDGKITKWGDPIVKSWSSQEDNEYFNKIWARSGLIVMGSKTYNKSQIKPASNHLLVIMTRNPLVYKDKYVKDQVEFTNKSPAELALHYENEGYKKMIVVGGAQIATSFLIDQLVDELWLTVEPRIFGKGDTIVEDTELDIKLRLISCKKVNRLGTLITKYVVL
jgi:dihydrofolate reductase